MAPRFHLTPSGHTKKKPPTTSAKERLLFPVGRIVRYLKKGWYARRISGGAVVYLAGVLESLAGEVLELAGEVAKDNKKRRITPRHLFLTLVKDQELAKLLHGVTIPQAGVVPYINKELIGKKTKKKIADLKKKTARWTKKTVEKADKWTKKTAEFTKKA